MSYYIINTFHDHTAVRDNEVHRISMTALRMFVWLSVYCLLVDVLKPCAFMWDTDLSRSREVFVLINDAGLRHTHSLSVRFICGAVLLCWEAHCTLLTANWQHIVENDFFSFTVFSFSMLRFCSCARVCVYWCCQIKSQTAPSEVIIMTRTSTLPLVASSISWPIVSFLGFPNLISDLKHNLFSYYTTPYYPL